MDQSLVNPAPEHVIFVTQFPDVSTSVVDNDSNTDGKSEDSEPLGVQRTEPEPVVKSLPVGRPLLIQVMLGVAAAVLSLGLLSLFQPRSDSPEYGSRQTAGNSESSAMASSGVVRPYRKTVGSSGGNDPAVSQSFRSWVLNRAAPKEKLRSLARTKPTRKTRALNAGNQFRNEKRNVKHP